MSPFYPISLVTLSCPHEPVLHCMCFGQNSSWMRIRESFKIASDTTNPKRRSIASATCYSPAFLERCYRVFLALSLINTIGKETYLEKHLNFGWVKLIAFFDTRVSFEERASSNSSAHPFDRDHFTVSCYECCVTVFSDKSRFDS